MHPEDPSLSAEIITKKSGSNLAFSFFSLTPERRRDMAVFYAFCRIIDDIADEKGVDEEERQRLLDAWKESVSKLSLGSGRKGLGSEVSELIVRREISPEYFLKIIEGCEMDITIKRYPDFESLVGYCYRVASAVGLVSIEIFGYSNQKTQDYAVELGYALQLTNILRDVAVDWRNDERIYLPADEMARFGYSETDLAAGIWNSRFLELMEFQADRAQSYYARADASLTTEDRPSMIAAQVMRAMYWKILTRLRKDRYQVFRKSYRLGKLTKLWTALRTVAVSPR